ncbi:hypothetical protein LITTLEE_161 [Mycobacterium phage LittleE]|uniref:Uncharacterized protein n=1 Tax=Mycobacterium phage LittleE TaxID=2922212 RepID=G1D446_9CAUD|nr:hypothetical protein FGG27_gp161 [Mycobacterium phage LittleE]AEK09541.1 hypothetical protein LITTLEE_161 [Mycobacterium phage LittleE]
MTDYRTGLSIAPVNDDLGSIYDAIFYGGREVGVITDWRYEPEPNWYMPDARRSPRAVIALTIQLTPRAAAPKPKRRTYTEAYGLRRPR